VGAEEMLLLDQESGEIAAADRFLLCSDGIHGVLDHARIAEVLATIEDPHQAAQTLLAAAVDAGTSDNITAVVVDIIADALPALHPQSGSGDGRVI
jgi:serine/threonine protein phosphatase PrpC